MKMSGRATSEKPRTCDDTSNIHNQNRRVGGLLHRGEDCQSYQLQIPDLLNNNVVVTNGEEVL